MALTPTPVIRNYLFHRVNPERDLLWDPMDITLFDKCVSYLTKNYSVELFEDVMQGKNLTGQKRPVATIMFDDGYKDNFEFALPILDKYKVKASFYVVTDCIDKGMPTWTHFLDYSFQYTKITRIHMDHSFLPENLRVTELVNKEAKIEYVRRLKPILKLLKHEEREEVLNTVRNAYSDISIPQMMMNWKDLVELRSAGHYVGSHTVTHAMLGTMRNDEEQLYELVNSGKRIHDELGYFPLTISYPVGSYNETTKELSRQAGYKFGLAVNQQPFNPVKQDSFEIPRMELYNESWWKTNLRIKNIPARISRTWKKS
jgi:peptidoglycan/xylan/chitin deacetylase (PgdA/CDA1 family)